MIWKGLRSGLVMLIYVTSFSLKFVVKYKYDKVNRDVSALIV